jgi:hypothetical protein
MMAKRKFNRTNTIVLVGVLLWSGLFFWSGKTENMIAFWILLSPVLILIILGVCWVVREALFPEKLNNLRREK